ncbi:MAG: FtsX-like permease family protein [bacterium]|nr:FtsX-like permease family protein [bacterium]
MNSKRRKPPWIAKSFLNLILPGYTGDPAIGDYEELYNRIAAEKGNIRAAIWFWLQIIKVIPVFFGDSIYWRYAMYKNYFKTTIRNIFKHKGYSAINVLGLSLGIACCLLIYLWVSDELSYDKFHEGWDSIYRIDWISENPQTRTPYNLTHLMTKDFPEVLSAVSLHPAISSGFSRSIFTVRYNDNRFDEQGVFLADTSFFSVFSFNLLKGDPETVLNDPMSIVITESIAEKYFGDEDPIGKILIFDDGYSLKVSGVMENIPEQSHIHFDFLYSYLLSKQLETGDWFDWDWGHYNYIKLSEGTDHLSVEAKIPGLLRKYYNGSESFFQSIMDGRTGFKLTPLTDIHLRSDIKWELEQNGNIYYVYVFSASAIFILIIACINFMNLATARSLNRAKEVGLRKTVGAYKSTLIIQFLGESLVFSLLSIIVGVVMLGLTMPFFNELTGKAFTMGNVLDFDVLLGMFSLLIIVGLFSGSYPAFFLSSFNPVNVLKGDIQAGSRNTSVRKFLVHFQFSMAIILIIGTFIIKDQVSFLKNKDLGFNKDHVMVIRMKGESLRLRYKAIKTELLKHQSVISASAVSNVPGTQFNQNEIFWKSREDEIDVSELRVDHDFFKTLDIKFAEGRGYSEEFPSDNNGNAFILNEAAANSFSWDTPVGKTISWDDDRGMRQSEVVGVAGDFHFKSLHESIQPMIFAILPGYFNYMLVRIDSNDMENTVNYVEEVWKTFDQSHTFEYTFLDEEYNRNYMGEDKMSSIFSVFSFLAIVIGCLGLLGLTSFVAEQRTKEIGIRKVLGSTIPGIILLMSKDFTRLVLAANLIAWPLAYFTMNNWLQNFAYRSDIDLLKFVYAAGLVLVITVITVGYHAVRAAKNDPVNALKYE